jgi:hypothetical protein
MSRRSDPAAFVDAGNQRFGLFFDDDAHIERFLLGHGHLPVGLALSAQNRRHEKSGPCSKAAFVMLLRQGA